MSLTTLQVILLREAARDEALSCTLQQAGAHVLHLPVSRFSACKICESTRNQLRSRFDGWLFPSVNAVKFSQSIWPDRQPHQVFAVGPQTANALTSAGFERVMAPDAAPSGKSLLALEVLQAVSGQRFVVFHGHPHRPELDNTLRERGAEVLSICCYTSLPVDHLQLPEIAPPTLLWLTSAQNLKYLLAQLGTSLKQWQDTVQILALSNRLAQIAQLAGFKKNPLICTSTHCGAIHSAIEAWYAEAVLR